MDIERLSKSQIVLLTLLISFVTSIATGIVTVSLMDQAPPVIAQTVNRVIERTIQIVASTTPKGQTAATIVTQQKTVIVKEADLISQAVTAVSPSIVRLYTSNAETFTFLGLGIILDASGAIITDMSALGDNADALAELSSGERVRVFVSARDSDAGIAHMSAATTTTEGTPIVWKPVAISSDHPLLGGTVVMLAGKTVARIAGGIITTLIPAAQSVPPVIETDIAADSIMSGSPLINTDGSLIGVSTGISRTTSPSGFISASVLVKQSKNEPAKP